MKTDHPNRLAKQNIQWSHGATAAQRLTCPMCRHEAEGHPWILSVSSMANGAELRLHQCIDCDGKFFNPPDINDFEQLHGAETTQLKHYIEVGCGIWDIYWPAAKSTLHPNASLLDVGCGFGFLVDIWRQLGGEAIGIELANYGQIGKRMLDIIVYNDYLENIDELSNKKFAVVYASEVIEHVAKPMEFIQVLSHYVADDGVLCLTTPNGDYIRQENESPTLLAALSPGYHGFLYSPKGLENVLHANGFKQVIVQARNERLFAWAGKTHFSINENDQQIRHSYLTYLQQTLTGRQELDWVFDGIAYRYLRDAIFQGDIANARQTIERLASSLPQKYGDEILQPNKISHKLLALESQESFSQNAPWFLPNLYYLIGKYLKITAKNIYLCRDFFHAARIITWHITNSWGGVFVLEMQSWLFDAWLQEAVIGGLTKDPSTAIELIANIKKMEAGIENALENTKPSTQEIERALIELIAIIHRFGHLEQTSEALDTALSYLQARYHDWFHAETHAQSDKMPGHLLPIEQRVLLSLVLAETCIKVNRYIDKAEKLLTMGISLAPLIKNPSRRKQLTERTNNLLHKTHSTDHR
jgi:2-polyprenyl-3-methyl-5-hydroxy-6-metoxy-1,4-benzoquinol methylase